ncbi:uncharacterized protein LOC123524809 [Mercenaria mercenaria]|uniref:uncharacterized protein LOC123524809 n=1 Tax=Mercenaria mercenaria TaxID=6596 RepID=UPI00234E397D|nr:uncharacterized protein LOC123524809 [Mercenaria mercenaria]
MPCFAVNTKLGTETNMWKLVLVGLLLGTSFGPVDCLLGWLFEGVGKIIGSVVKPVFGIDKFERQAEQGRHSVEAGIATFNGNVANSLRNLDTYVKNEIIPEIKKMTESGTEIAESAKDMADNAKKLVNEVIEVLIPAATETLDAARDMMFGITDSTKQVANSTSRLLDTATDVLIPETAQTLNTTRWMMIEFVNITRGIQGRIGQSLDNVDYILELLIALMFMFLGFVCGYELRRVGYILRPRGFVALEICLLKWSRIVCFVSAFLLAVRIILKMLQISLFSKPERLLFFILFPILSVFSYYVLRLLLFLFHLLCTGLYYLFCLVKYLLYFPYLILYYVFLAPFVLTYECFVNRNTHLNRIGALIIYCMPVIFCLLYCGCEEVMDSLLKATEKENSNSVDADAEYSLTWLYSLLVTFVAFYLVAVVLKFCYPPPVPRPFVAGVRVTETYVKSLKFIPYT